jgi:hypothetical protein
MILIHDIKARGHRLPSVAAGQDVARDRFSQSMKTLAVTNMMTLETAAGTGVRAPGMPDRQPSW